MGIVIPHPHPLPSSIISLKVPYSRHLFLPTLEAERSCAARELQNKINNIEDKEPVQNPTACLWRGDLPHLHNLYLVFGTFSLEKKHKGQGICHAEKRENGNILRRYNLDGGHISPYNTATCCPTCLMTVILKPPTTLPHSIMMSLGQFASEGFVRSWGLWDWSFPKCLSTREARFHTPMSFICFHPWDFYLQLSAATLAP